MTKQELETIKRALEKYEEFFDDGSGYAPDLWKCPSCGAEAKVETNYATFETKREVMIHFGNCPWISAMNKINKMLLRKNT